MGIGVLYSCVTQQYKSCWERFSERSVPRCYKQDKLVVRQSPAPKDVNTEVEEAMALEAVTRRQPVEDTAD
jgi:hypothetical protein